MQDRLVSLDFLRGLIMVLLALESTELFVKLNEQAAGLPVQPVIQQFFHHPWHGLTFWDLVQPIFMFVAGTAMAFSVRKLKPRFSGFQLFAKVLKRCWWLFFWGVLNYAVRDNQLSFELWNVLTQLAFTTLVAFLIMEFSIAMQIVISLLFLLIPEMLYRFTNIPGFDQPFVDQHNFGNYMDLVLMNKINSGGWVAINCISTAAHTIWGVLAGKLLLSNRKPLKKVSYLSISGLILLTFGFALDWTAITPIIKRIATSSFVLASGGWCLLFLAFCYWSIDVLKRRKGLYFFTIVGMNSIFIYLFFEIVGARWFNEYIGTIAEETLHFLQVQPSVSGIITSLVIFSIEWYLCYFLYRNKIFFKL